MKELLQDFNKNTLREVVERDFPELEIRSFEVFPRGWDYVTVDVNDEIILRFPKGAKSTGGNKIGAAELEREMKILRFLKGKIALKIPDYELIGKSYFYAGYRKIKGTDLDEGALSVLTERERERAASDLANFLFEFHGAFTVQEARKMGIEKENHQLHSKNILRRLAGKIEDEVIVKLIDQLFQEYNATESEESELAVLYSDLHGENIAFDVEQRRVNGVFDFGDVRIGGVYHEFILHWFDGKMMQEILREYKRLSGRGVDIEKVRLHSRIRRLNELAMDIGSSDPERFNGAMRELRGWTEDDQNGGP